MHWNAFILLIKSKHDRIEKTEQLKDLVELEFFTAGTPDGKVFTAPFPKVQQNRFIFDYFKISLFQLGKGFIHIFHVKCNMVHMAITSV